MSQTAPSPSQLREWTQRLAHDPSSSAFLPLALAYSRLGWRDAAIQLCLRGLAHTPEHVEAHVLLGVLYRQAGDFDKAFDEWDIALHLDPEHAEARREIGLLCEERGDPAAATRYQQPAAQVAASPAHAALAPSIRLLLERFVGSVRPDGLLLIASSGRLLGHHGFTREFDTIGLAALAAGIHATSTALARLLQEQRFGHVYQRGAGTQIFLGACGRPGEELILIVIMRDETRLGLLRVAFGVLSREIALLPPESLPKPARSAETFERELDRGWADLFGDADGTGRRTPLPFGEFAFSPS